MDFHIKVLFFMFKLLVLKKKNQHFVAIFGCSFDKMWNISSLYRMAEEHGMKLVFKTPFAEFFNEKIKDRDHKNLLSRMKALEVLVKKYYTPLSIVTD